MSGKKCKEENCDKTAIYNLQNEKIGIYCKDHTKENMVNVISKRCLEYNCNIQASFNISTENIGIYCSKHKKENMIDIISKCCKECNDTQVKNKKYKGYCLRCFIDTFPDEKITSNHKVKEKHMADFIKNEFKDEKITFDKQIIGGSSKRRPDVYIDKITYVLICECDENQHNLYDNEDVRLIEIIKDIKKPVVFIRFNPDKYINKDGKKILSSFKLNKSGKLIIRNNQEWNNRLELLKASINKWLSIIPDKEVTNEYLFYDA